MRSTLSLLAALLLTPALAHAHAILIDSTPAAGSSVPAGPQRVMLRFNSRIDPARSRLLLLGTPGTLPIMQSGPAELVTTVTLVPGRTVLRWQVLAIDGHVTRGDLVFGVVAP